MRSALRLLVLLSAAALATAPALAFVYTSGDVLYVAYQSPSGPNYIVNLGSRTQFVNATTTITFPNVLASDLNGVIGASAPNIWVGLFGVLNPTTRDGLVSANGPIIDDDLLLSSILGATGQIDSFGNGVRDLSLAVPSGNPNAGKFASAGSAGSYQSTLNGSTKGTLGSNVHWDVETALSNASGVRNPAPVNISFYVAIRNTVVGTFSRRLIGFFKLNPDGTLTYSPDADGDFIPDDIDLCPGVNSTDNSDTDGDHHAPACDCNPADGTVWGIPAEVATFTFSNSSGYSWPAPSDLGGTASLY
ncbi:MAG TPA: hypothetical protein VKF61_07825, partial [Candidatus Polarisedimenticolia bacterium]|nr:hypothetical protein [Candidatus Polarisedimenticolia bacterium]